MKLSEMALAIAERRIRPIGARAGSPVLVPKIVVLVPKKVVLVPKKIEYPEPKKRDYQPGLSGKKLPLVSFVGHSHAPSP